MKWEDVQPNTLNDLTPINPRFKSESSQNIIIAIVSNYAIKYAS